MSLFAGNVSHRASPEEVRAFFSKFGPCRVDVKRGYAFIDYDDDRDAADARNDTNSKDFHGMKLNVEWSKKHLARTAAASGAPPPDWDRGRRSRYDDRRSRDHDRDYDRDSRRRFDAPYDRDRVDRDKDRDRDPDRRFGYDRDRDDASRYDRGRNDRDRRDRDRYNRDDDRHDRGGPRHRDRSPERSRERKRYDDNDKVRDDGKDRARDTDDRDRKDDPKIDDDRAKDDANKRDDMENGKSHDDDRGEAAKTGEPGERPKERDNAASDRYDDRDDYRRRRRDDDDDRDGEADHKRRKTDDDDGRPRRDMDSHDSRGRDYDARDARGEERGDRQVLDDEPLRGDENGGVPKDAAPANRNTELAGNADPDTGARDERGHEGAPGNTDKGARAVGPDIDRLGDENGTATF